jgi:hypothetical protein
VAVVWAEVAAEADAVEAVDLEPATPTAQPAAKYQSRLIFGRNSIWLNNKNNRQF